MMDARSPEAMSSIASRSGRLYAGLVALAALFAATVLIVTVGDDLGISGDSTQYLSAAQNVASGKGLMALWWTGRAEPLTHFPPLYPVLVALLTGASGDPADAAYLLNVFLAPVNVLLMALLASCATRGLSPELRSRAAMVAAVCGSVANHLLLVRAMAWSEPLFNTLLLLSLIGLLNVLEYPERAGWYLLMVCAAAAAALTRFVGVALIGALCLAILLLQHAPLRRRRTRAVVVGVASVLPTAVVLAYGALQGRAVSNRHLAVHLIGRADIATGMTTVLDWAVPVAPYTTLSAVFIGMYIVAAALLIVPLLSRGSQLAHDADGIAQDSTKRMAKALGIFVAIYFAFLMVSISFADRSTRLDKRILSPALAVTLVIAVALGVRRLGAVRTLPSRQRVLTRSGLAMLLAVYVLAQMNGLLIWSARAQSNGLGFAQVERSSRQLVARIRQLPPSAVLYSNRPYIVNYLTGRNAVGIPFRFSPTSMQTNDSLPHHLAAMRAAASRNVVYFIDFGGVRQSYLVSDSIMAGYVHIDTVDILPGGRIDIIEPQN